MMHWDIAQALLAFVVWGCIWYKFGYIKAEHDFDYKVRKVITSLEGKLNSS